MKEGRSVRQERGENERKKRVEDGISGSEPEAVTPDRVV